LPRDFPEHRRLLDAQIRRDIDFALANRPELVELDLMYESIGVELAKAENALLPKLDAVVEASQDAGARTTPENVKGPFELEAGLYGEVPLQRREARGKVEAARAKRAQIRAKREFAANQVTAEVQDALSALRAAEARIERARTNAQLAGDTLRLGRSQFDAGDIDLVELNIYEQAATDAQFLLIDAQADFFIGLADYRAALGQDPLQDPLSPP
jgi:outer membrane protein TolC